MRFAYVLLGLVAFTSVHTSSGQQCSNSLAGVQNNDICCDAACGTCGGGGCGRRPGGADNCCSSRIRDSGVMCSASQAAPCIVENESMCDNGVAGIQSGDICCDSTCGTCGGSGCSRLPGGSSSCCSSRIRDAGLMCSDTAASPCIIDAIIPEDALCSNGLPGVQDGDICCDASCGTCGGAGCARRPGGSESCCSSRIRESAMMCDATMTAPCIIDATAAPTSAPTAAPTAEPTAAPTAEPTAAPTAEPTAAPTEATCSNGLVGIENNGICCALSCGTCGGPACGLLTGGAGSCCSNVINNNGMACSATMEAPCIIDN